MAKDKRFITTHKEGSEFSSTAWVFVDRETGVNYIFIKSGYAGGLTPLLDRDGKPVVTTVNPADFD